LIQLDKGLIIGYHPNEVIIWGYLADHTLVTRSAPQ